MTDTDHSAGASALTDPHVIVVMPAYNAASTVADTFRAIPPGVADEIILVDDGSSDETASIATDLGIEVIVHRHNLGYGGNQKTCYMEALKRGADIVVMLHPDGQYDPTLVPDIIEPIKRGEADLVLGSRFPRPGGPAAGNMPRYKIIANRFLTTCENWILGTHFSELHTGYRAYSRHFLETIPFLRNVNDFSFDTQVIAQAVNFGLATAEIPVETKYFEEASSISLVDSTVYGLKTLGVMLRYALHKRGILKAAIFLR